MDTLFPFGQFTSIPPAQLSDLQGLAITVILHLEEIHWF